MARRRLGWRGKGRAAVLLKVCTAHGKFRWRRGARRTVMRRRLRHFRSRRGAGARGDGAQPNDGAPAAPPIPGGYPQGRWVARRDKGGPSQISPASPARGRRCICPQQRARATARAGESNRPIDGEVRSVPYCPATSARRRGRRVEGRAARCNSACTSQGSPVAGPWFRAPPVPVCPDGRTRPPSRQGPGPPCRGCRSMGGTAISVARAVDPPAPPDRFGARDFHVVRRTPRQAGRHTRQRTPSRTTGADAHVSHSGGVVPLPPRRRAIGSSAGSHEGRRATEMTDTVDDVVRAPASAPIRQAGSRLSSRGEDA